MNIRLFRFRIVTMVILAALTMMACSKSDDDTPFGLVGDAEVWLSIGLDSEENEQSIGGDAEITKAAPTIDPHKDMAVYVINTENDTLARWACFDDVPKKLKFTPGAYKIVAEYKSRATKVPDFDIYVYRAEEKFVIKSGDQLHFNMVAKLGTANISVTFDPSFKFHYFSYSVDIRTVGDDFLRFNKTEKRVGSFEPGNVRMRFNLRTMDDEVLSFSPKDPLPRVNAADHYKLTLKVDSKQGTAQVIIIGTDAELDMEDIEVEVPLNFLPKDKPLILETVGFNSGESQSLIEGSTKQWSMKAVSLGGLKSFVIKLNDGANDGLANMLGGREFDLMSLPKDDPARAKLKAAGFVWHEALNNLGGDNDNNCTDPWIDFTDVMIAADDGELVRYDLNIEMEDNFNQSIKPCEVIADIRASVVMIDNIVAGDIWTNKAYFIVKADYDLVGGTHPLLQYRKTAGGDGVDWSEGVERASDFQSIGSRSGTLIVSAKPQDEGMYVAGYELKGLQSGVEYEFRVLANGRVKVPADGNVKWTTESELTVPGLTSEGGFHGWTKQNALPALAGKGQMEVPLAGWATRNALSMSQKAKSKNADTGSGTVNASEVSANNGTTPIGEGAIELRTTGWGQGTYSNSNSENKGKTGAAWTGVDGSPKIKSRVRNVSSGILYLGTYNFDSNTLDGAKSEMWEYATDRGWGVHRNETIYYPFERYNGGENRNEAGTGFASRPKSLSFEYKFDPAEAITTGFLIKAELYAADGVTKVAELSWSDKTLQKFMTTKSLDFVYTEAGKSLKAATLKILFSSDENLSVAKANENGDGAKPVGSPSLDVKVDGKPHTGNVLVIDKVTLGYDF